MTDYCFSISSFYSFSSDEPFNLLSSLHINHFVYPWATPVVSPPSYWTLVTL
ncbi:hypothetical protein HanPI659440_Chr16g0657141 [Helianthus annuus]|nr:hypothetical protein HanPI659440_Chr16g0657141 [Helianthus annuus]